MKKVFGVLFLVIGLIMIISGIAALTNVATRNHTIDGQLQNAFNNNYRMQSNAEQAIGGVLIVSGGVLFILGLVMVVTKSNVQRRKEAELAAMKKMQSVNASSAKNGTEHIGVDNLTAQAINLYNQKDYYSSLVVLKKALALNPTLHQTHFNMACVYSQIQDTEGFNSLSKAVEYGFINFEKIKTQKDLEWLRNHTEYSDFVRNGYVLKAKASYSNNTNYTSTNSQNDIYTQLEKLGRLKEKGLITDEEFMQQKKKILA